jgi:hypothetical protein
VPKSRPSAAKKWTRRCPSPVARAKARQPKHRATGEGASASFLVRCLLISYSNEGRIRCGCALFFLAQKCLHLDARRPRLLISSRTPRVHPVRGKGLSHLLLFALSQTTLFSPDEADRGL